MANKLKDMVIDEASFVDMPANKLAKIMFFKRDGVDHCGSCGVGTIGADGACDFCWNRQVQRIEKPTFFKRTEDRTMNVLPGKSEKDTIWTTMEEAFDRFQKQTNDSAYRQEGSAFTPLSRDKLFSKWLASEEGAKLYAEYEQASDVVTPIQKSEEPPNLKEFGWEKLEAIAKRHQQEHGGTLEGAHLACARGNEAYGRIYGLLDEAYPLATVDFADSGRISKSKSDAISLLKAKIVVEAGKGL